MDGMREQEWGWGDRGAGPPLGAPSKERRYPWTWKADGGDRTASEDGHPASNSNSS